MNPLAELLQPARSREMDWSGELDGRVDAGEIRAGATPERAAGPGGEGVVGTAIEGRGRGAVANVSPLLQKGAILVLEPNTGVPLNTIKLQYNPETIRRHLQPQSVGDQPDRTRSAAVEGTTDRDDFLRRGD